MIKKAKEFYKKKKDFVWFAVIIICVFFAYSLVSSPHPGHFGGYGDMMEDSSAEMDYSYNQRGVSTAKMMAAPSMAPLPPMNNGDEGYFEDEERKIKKTGNLNVEVETEYYNTAKNGIDNIISAREGFYTNKNEYKSSWQGNDYRTYTVTFKVPFDNFEAALNDAKKLGELTNLNVYASDMTTQYVDAKAYLDSYTKEKARVEKLLEKAETIDEIMQVENKLSQLQRTIDDYQRQVTNIDRQTDYSSISLTLEEKKPAIEEFYKMTPLRDLLRNFVSGLDSIFVAISRLLSWILGALLIFAIYKGYKALRR